MTLSEFLQRFDRKARAGDQWKVTCPAHDDRKASLAVRAGTDGKILLHCHAGCSTERILEGMQLTHADLFVTPSGDRKEHQKREIAAYDYRAEDGTLLCQTVRYEPKDFRQRRPDGKDGWTWNLRGVRRVLYRLPDLKGKEAVVVVEGEKDVEMCWKIGFPATCNIGGASSWRPEYAQQLVAAGVKRVRIIPDNDAAGLDHSDRVAQSCIAAGIDARIVRLPDLPEKGDVSDYLATHSKAELVAIVKNAPQYVRPTAAHATCNVPQNGLDFVDLGDLLVEPDETIDWLVEERLPSGSVVLLAGKPKAGKSTLARDLALQVAKGGQWLGWPCSAGPVWYLVFEDKRSEVKKHFRAMEAGPDDPVRFLFKQPGEDLLAELHKLAAQEKPALIIVDTLQRLVRARDLNDYAEVTTKLTPILTLSRETGATLLLVHHAGKSDRAGIDAVLGSTALAGSVDNILLFGRSERYRMLSSQQRIGPDLPQTVVLFDEQSGRVSIGHTREQADLEHMKADMLEVLRESPEPVTEPKLCKEVEGRGKVKRKALRELVAAGQVERLGHGRRGDPYRYCCSLVPLYMREQENKNSKSPGNVDKHESDSRSRETTLFKVSEQVSEQEIRGPVDEPDQVEVGEL